MWCRPRLPSRSLIMNSRSSMPAGPGFLFFEVVVAANETTASRKPAGGRWLARAFAQQLACAYPPMDPEHREQESLPESLADGRAEDQQDATDERRRRCNHAAHPGPFRSDGGGRGEAPPHSTDPAYAARPKLPSLQAIQSPREGSLPAESPDTTIIIAVAPGALSKIQSLCAPRSPWASPCSSPCGSLCRGIPLDKRPSPVPSSFWGQHEHSFTA